MQQVGELKSKQPLALVTGGSGFIGSALIEKLVQSGFRVRALLRSTSALSNLASVTYETSIGDLRNQDSLENACRDVDYIFHLAGCVTASSREEFMEHNAAGTARLAAAALKTSPALKRFIYVSSVSAIGPSPTAVPIDESAVPNPISDYGASKRQGELDLDMILATKPLTIVRPPPVYGPRDRGIFQFIKILNKGVVPMILPSNPSAEKTFSFIYVDDLVDLIAATATAAGQGNREAYFAVGDQPYVWAKVMGAGLQALGRNRFIRLSIPVSIVSVLAQLSLLVTKLSGHKFELTPDKVREMRPDYYVYSNRRAKERLGFEEKVKIDEGMKRAVKWYKENKWL